MALKLSREYLNPYEKAYDLYSGTPAFSKQAWEYYAKGNDSSVNLDMYIGALAKAKDIDFAKFNEDYNFTNSSAENQGAALMNEFYADREKLKTRTGYKADAAGNRIPYEYKATDYDYYKEAIKAANDEYFRQQEIDHIKQEQKDLAWVAKAGSVAGHTVGELSLSMQDAFNKLWKMTGGVLYQKFKNNLSMEDAIKAATMEETAYGELLDRAWVDLRDWELKYSGMRDEYGNYTTLGKYFGGAGTMIGEMLPAILADLGITVATGGVGAGTAAAHAISVAKTAISQLVFYTPVMHDYMEEDFTKFSDSVCAPTTAQIVAESATKAALQATIEYGLGKVLGAGALETFRLGLKTPAITSAGAIATTAVRGAFSEGTEEVLQDLSDFFVDKAFAKLANDNFGELAEVTPQSLWDSFSVAAFCSLLGSGATYSYRGIVGQKTMNFKTDADGKLVLDKNGAPVQETLHGTKAIVYNMTMQSLSEHFQEALDTASKLDKLGNVNNKYKEELRKDIVDTYKSLRTIADFYGSIGEDRAAAAESILNKVQSDLNEGKFEEGYYAQQAENIVSQLSAMQADIVISATLKDELTESETGKPVETISKDEEGVTSEVVDETLTDEDKEKLDKFKEQMSETLDKLNLKGAVVTDGGTSITVEGSYVVVPKNMALHFSQQTFVQAVEEKRFIDKVATLPFWELSKTTKSWVLKAYKTVSGSKTASFNKAVAYLLYDKDFFRYCLVNANKDMYKFLSIVADMESEIDVESISNQDYKKRITLSLESMKLALVEYLENQQVVNESDFPKIISSDKATAKHITAVRYAKNLYNRVVSGQKLSETDRVILDNRINYLQIDEQRKASLRKNIFESEKPETRANAMNYIANLYEGVFTSLYDGKTYLAETSHAAYMFNMWLKSVGLTISTMFRLDNNGKKFLSDLGQETTKDNLIAARIKQFASYTGDAFIFSYDSNINSISLIDNNTNEYAGGTAVSQSAQSIDYDVKPTINGVETERVASRLAGKQSDVVLSILSDTIDKSIASNMDINDVIYNPDVLNNDLKAKIIASVGNLSPDNVYSYLRAYFIDTLKNTTIDMTSAGDVVFVELKPFTDLFVDNIEIKDGMTIKDITKDNSLPPKVQDTKIEFVDMPAGYDGSYVGFERAKIVDGRTVYESDPDYKNIKHASTVLFRNTIFVNKNITNRDWQVVTLAHELQHAYQVANGLNFGFDPSFITRLSSVARRRLVNDVRSHNEKLFSNVSKNSTDERQLVSQIIYYCSGESSAFGLTGSKAWNFIPFSVKYDKDKNLVLYTPWNTNYTLATRAMLQRDMTEYKNNLDKLDELLSKTSANLADRWDGLGDVYGFKVKPFKDKFISNYNTVAKLSIEALGETYKFAEKDDFVSPYPIRILPESVLKEYLEDAHGFFNNWQYSYGINIPKNSTRVTQLHETIHSIMSLSYLTRLYNGMSAKEVLVKFSKRIYNNLRLLEATTHEEIYAYNTLALMRYDPEKSDEQQTRFEEVITYGLTEPHVALILSRIRTNVQLSKNDVSIYDSLVSLFKECVKFVKDNPAVYPMHSYEISQSSEVYKAIQKDIAVLHARPVRSVGDISSKYSITNILDRSDYTQADRSALEGIQNNIAVQFDELSGLSIDSIKEKITPEYRQQVQNILSILYRFKDISDLRLPVVKVNDGTWHIAHQFSLSYGRFVFDDTDLSRYLFNNLDNIQLSVSMVKPTDILALNEKIIDANDFTRNLDVVIDEANQIVDKYSLKKKFNYLSISSPKYVVTNVSTGTVLNDEPQAYSNKPVGMLAKKTTEKKSSDGQILEHAKRKGVTSTRYVSEKTAKGTNFEGWFKKYQNRHIREDMFNFVTKATSDIAPSLWNKIERKTLKRQDIMKWLYEAKPESKNAEETFTLINECFFQNKNIKSFKELSELAIPYRTAQAYALRAILSALDLREKLIDNDYTSMDKLDKLVRSTDAKLPNGHVVANEYQRIIDRFETMGTGEILTYGQGTLRTLWLRWYDGSIDSAGSIGAIAKVVAAGVRMVSFGTSGASKDTGDEAEGDVREGKRKGANLTFLRGWNTAEMSNTSDIDLSQDDIDTFNEVIYDTAPDKMLKDLKLYETFLLGKEGKSGFEISKTVENIERLFYDEFEEFEKLYRQILIDDPNAIANVLAINTLLESNGMDAIEVNVKSNEKAVAEAQNFVNNILRTPGSVMNNIRRITKEINKYAALSTKVKKQIAAKYPDLFDSSLKLKREAYSSDITTTDGKVLKHRLKDANTLLTLKDVLNKILYDVRQGYYDTKANLKRYEKAVKRTQDLIDAFVAAKDNNSKQQTVNAETVKTEIRYVGGYETIQVYGDRKVPEVFQTMLSHELEQTAKTDVKYVSNDTDYHVKMNYEKFVSDNVETLSYLTQDDVNELVDYFANTPTIPATNNAGLYTSVEQICIAYLMLGDRTGKWLLTDEQRELLRKKIQLVGSAGGQMLVATREAEKIINPEKTLLQAAAKLAGVELNEKESRAILNAIISNDPKRIIEARRTVLNSIKSRYVAQKLPFFDKLVRFQRLAMLSGPGTWIRNWTSNIIIEQSDKVTTAIGKATEKLIETLFPKTKLREDIKQYSLDGKVSEQYSSFIQKEFIDSGLFAAIADGATKYDTRKAEKNTTADIVATMIRNSIESELMFRNTLRFSEKKSKVYNELGKAATKFNNFVFKMMSDDAFVRKFAINAFGHILEQDNIDITHGTTNDVLVAFAEAYKLAADTYMHKSNIISKAETYVRLQLNEKFGKGKAAAIFFAYKQILPFAGASWNWFIEGLKYTPAGLAKAITNFAKLEKEIDRIDNVRRLGTDTYSSKFAKYVVTKDIGKGVIGSIGFMIGALLAISGRAGIDNDENKLFIGDLTVDISDLFGTQGILLGMSMVNTINSDGASPIDVIAATLDQMMLDSAISDVYNSFRYSANVGDWIIERTADSVDKLYPNFVKTFASMSKVYDVNYSSGIQGRLEKLYVKWVPGATLTPLVSPYINPYTGKAQEPTVGWFLSNAISKLTPLKVEKAGFSKIEKIAVDLGINKSDLKGIYTVNNRKITLSQKERQALNMLYGKLNAKDLEDFVNNKVKYIVTDSKSGKDVEKTYSKMTDNEKATVIKRIMSNNSDLSKKYILCKTNNVKYYAGDTEYQRLKSLGTPNVYLKDGKHDGYKLA